MKYSSPVRNILARFKAMVIKAINKQKLLPKAFIFVPNDDIIKQSGIPFDEAKDGEYRLIMKYLLEEIHRLVMSYKDQLPKKSKIDYFPHFVWIVPPQHKYFSNNYLRGCFASALEAEVEKYQNTCALSLKKIWETNEGALYLHEQRHFTEQAP